MMTKLESDPYEINVARAWFQKWFPIAVILAVVVALVALLFLIPSPDADAATVPTTSSKAVKKMTYGSGTLGPLGARIRNGDMATADVAIFGDSITGRGYLELKNFLAASGGHTLATDAQGSRPITGTVDALLEYPQLPPIVIMAAGTNDIFAPPVVGAQVDRAKAILEGKTLLWINVQACRTGASYDTATRIADQRNTGWVNAQIASRLPASQIIDWNVNFASKPERIGWYLQDGVHPWAGVSPAGYDGTAHWRAVIMGKLGPVL